MTSETKLFNTRTASIDTSFVLFFLSVELARTAIFFSIDTLLLSLTTLMVLVLPYFIVEKNGFPAFSSWVSGRVVISILAMLIGFGLRQSVGVLLPESVGYLPMTLLIVSAAISSYFQIYGVLKLRLVK